MSKFPVHGRNAIRRALKSTWEDCHKNYKMTAKITGLSDGTVWRFLNKKGFWPRSPKVKKQVKKFGLSKGIVVGVRPLPKQPLPSREVSEELLDAIDTAREILDSADVPTDGRIIK